MTPILILACSASKCAAKRAPAKWLYTGAMFRMGLEYGWRRGWRIKVLSAKYGIVDQNDVLENYNLKLERPYAGVWPAENGFYLGGQNYFGQAPDHLRPLLPPGLRMGFALQHMAKLLQELER